MENPSQSKPRSRFAWIATAVMIVGFVPLFLTGPCTVIFGIPLLIAGVRSQFDGSRFNDSGMSDAVFGWGSISLAGLVIILAGLWLHRWLERR